MYLCDECGVPAGTSHYITQNWNRRSGMCMGDASFLLCGRCTRIDTRAGRINTLHTIYSYV